MKLNYNAPNREMAAHELDRFTEKWNQKYLYAIQSWKNKMVFPTDESLKKSVYLSLMQISNKWTQPIHN